MSEFWNFEIKETYTCGESQPPGFKYTGETDYYIGICYKDGMPKTKMPPDEVYELAINAKYYLWDKEDEEYQEIGDNGSPEDFLVFLSGLRYMRNRPFAISWPDEFDNYCRFNRIDLFQVHPWRELIRRHFDQRAIILDRDLMIHKTRGSG